MGLWAAYDCVYNGVFLILEIVLTHTFNPGDPYIVALEEKVIPSIEDEVGLSNYCFGWENAIYTDWHGMTPFALVD